MLREDRANVDCPLIIPHPPNRPPFCFYGTPESLPSYTERLAGRRCCYGWQEKLRESEQRLSGIINSITDHMSMVDKDHNIIWANDIAKQLFGPDIVGEKCYWCYHRRESHCESCLVMETFRDDQVHDHVTEVLDKDGNKRVFWCTSSVAAHDEQGRPRLVIEISRDITQRQQAEEALQEYQQRLKALASQLTIKEEKERRRIAADLHDHVGQSLALARMQIASVRKLASDPRQTATLDDISDSMRQTVQEIRDLVYDLSPPQLNEIGLSAAISEWLEEQVEKRYQIKTECVDNGPEVPMDKDVRAILFRSVRELVTNVIKHSRATQVKIKVNQDTDRAKVIVRDDGTGFDGGAISQSLKTEGGFGLFSIKERMADLGGSLEIVSEPGKGTEAILSVPLEKGRE